MNDSVISALISVVIAIGGAVLVLALRDQFSKALRRLNTPEKLVERRRNHEQRLLHPDWSFCERHLQRPVPLSLRELFNEHTLILSQNLKCGEAGAILSFDPLDERNWCDCEQWFGFDAVVFATLDSGGLIYLKSGRTESNTVWIDHIVVTDGDVQELAPDVATFVQRIRNANAMPNHPLRSSIIGGG